MNRRLILALVFAVAACGAGAVPAQAAPFTNGNIVVERVGTGAAALTSAATAVFLDEYTPGGALVQSISLPTTGTTAQRMLTESGSATSAGELTRSTNGQYIVMSGYDAALGTASVTSTLSSATNRVVGRVGSDGTIDTSTAITDAFSGDNFRSVASVDGTQFFLGGNAASSGPTRGVKTIAFGTQGPATSLDDTTNARQVGIFGGQLYVSSSALDIATVGSGLPTSGPQTVTPLPGLSGTTELNSAYSYYFADLDSGVAGLDTLYIADDSGTANIYKFSLVGGSWTANGSATLANARGLTGAVTGSSVTLFSSNGATVQTLTDATGYNQTLTATPTLVATAPTNTAFRGVALAPVAATAVSWRGGKAVARRGRGVLVSWKTGRDAASLGFNVLRARKGSKRRLKVTRKMISGSALSGPGGSSGSFRFRDPRGRRGDRYFVVARATDGTKKVHGPLVARTSNRKASR